MWTYHTLSRFKGGVLRGQISGRAWVRNPVLHIYIHNIQNRRYFVLTPHIYQWWVQWKIPHHHPQPGLWHLSHPSFFSHPVWGSLVPFSREYPVRSRDESWLAGRWLCLMNFVRRMGFERFPTMFGNDGGRTWPCWTLFALAPHPGFPPWSWSSSSNKIWIPACSSSSFLSCCAEFARPAPAPWCPETMADTESW